MGQGDRQVDGELLHLLLELPELLLQVVVVLLHLHLLLLILATSSSAAAVVHLLLQPLHLLLQRLGLLGQELLPPLVAEGACGLRV